MCWLMCVRVRTVPSWKWLLSTCFLEIPAIKTVWDFHAEADTEHLQPVVKLVNA